MFVIIYIFKMYQNIIVPYSDYNDCIMLTKTKSDNCHLQTVDRKKTYLLVWHHNNSSLALWYCNRGLVRTLVDRVY